MGPSKIEDDRDFHDPPDPVDADDFLGFDTKCSSLVISHYTCVHMICMYPTLICSPYMISAISKQFLGGHFLRIISDTIESSF